ncbi:MAG: transposase [Gemmataceae bacterium]
MNPREERGLIIAALCKLNKTPDGWLVPSQSSEMIYRVNVEKQTCTCPDHQEAGFKCKHLYAVEFTAEREVGTDGTVTETKTLTFTEKVTYKQDWPAYNLAQSIEKDRLQELLHDLCRGIEEPERGGAGRKPHSMKDTIFTSVFKVYSTFSSRRFSSDLREAHERGYLSKPIPGLKVPQFFDNPALTPILKSLIVQSSLPLRSVETKFAIDSSGFSTSKFERWFDHKYGITRRKCVWVKVHIACGVKTNVVTAVRILDKDAADSPQFVPLVKDTAKNFTIGEVSADKAYASLDNFEAVAECGGTGFMAFKSNTTGAVGGLFQKMFHYFQFKQDEYMKHYHQRSNVESTFSMVKRKFGDHVRSKIETAMVNEVLCKFVCHNLCCLIQEECELGIDPIFWPDAAPKALEVYRPV